MMDTVISLNDQRTADAFWTLLKPLKREVRQWLAIRLDESLKEQHDLVHTDNLLEAQKFVKTLSVHGEIPVPSDEKGIYALLDEKY